jgi:hypothetical protein
MKLKKLLNDDAYAVLKEDRQVGIAARRESHGGQSFWFVLIEREEDKLTSEETEELMSKIDRVENPST